jgi:hypothetical protein
MDDQGAGCTAYYVMRDAAQQRCWQWATATRAHNQETRFSRSLDKHARRTAIEYQGFHRSAKGRDRGSLFSLEALAQARFD